MDWFSVAQNDWNVYQDVSRIARFVEFGKITPEQYEEITGEVYV